MNRSDYYNYIDKRLNELVSRVLSRTKVNILDYNLHSENFFNDLLNILYNWKLVNINENNQNLDGIDLIDNSSKIMIQVSSSCIKKKIEESLEKEFIKSHPNYNLKFFFISTDGKKLKDKKYNIPHDINFKPKNDILDVQTLLTKILHSSIDKQREVYDFIKKELGTEIDVVKLDSNLAVIIDILSKEDLTNVEPIPNINKFEIEKKIDYNNLITTKSIIDDLGIYYNRLDKKYKEYDKLGVNKSITVLQSILKCYVELSSKKSCINEDILFLEVIEMVRNIVIKSKNFKEMMFEELDFYVSIIVVDAFIRCKIFKNPGGYNHVTT